MQYRLFPRGCKLSPLVAAILFLAGTLLGAPPSLPIRTDLKDYLWPTDAGHIITSVFGEYRRLHFHAGIDISTGDVTGYKVFAMRDGYVVRIHISPVGYGKIVYVRHPDGYTTAYAHLSRFAGVLEERAEQEQQRLQQYPIDMEFAPGEIPVKKGEVIAYTGDTGIGTPHLHVEIRDPNGEPINPQLCPALRAPDGIVPTIRKIAILPLDGPGESPANDRPRIYTPTVAGAGRYLLREPILVTGRSGLAVDARDRTEDTRFQRGLYHLQLCIDKDTVAACTYDRAPLQYAQLIGAEYDWPLAEQHDGRFARLFEEFPGVLPFFHSRPPSYGIIGPGTLSRGPHRFTITVEDIAGNRSSVEGTVIVTRPPMITAERRGDSFVIGLPDPAEVRTLEEAVLRADGRWSIRERTFAVGAKGRLLDLPVPRLPAKAVRFTAIGEWGERSITEIFPLETMRDPSPRLEVAHELRNAFVRIVARCNGTFTAPPSGSMREAEHVSPVIFQAVDINYYAATVPLDPDVAGRREIEVRGSVDGTSLRAEDAFAVYPILPKRNGTYLLDNGRLQIQFDSASVFGPLFLHVETLQSGNAPSYLLTPQWFILRHGLQVQVRPDSLFPHDGLYFRGRTGLRSLRQAASAESGSLNGRISQTLGTLAVRTDAQPPDLSRLFLRASRNRPLLISFRLTDNLSGVEYESVKLYIDTTPVIPSIDGEHRRVQYQSSAPLERGPHRFLMRCSDRAGNVRTVERHFMVR